MFIYMIYEHVYMCMYAYILQMHADPLTSVVYVY